MVCRLPGYRLRVLACGRGFLAELGMIDEATLRVMRASFLSADEAGKSLAETGRFGLRVADAELGMIHCAQGDIANARRIAACWNAILTDEERKLNDE